MIAMADNYVSKLNGRPLKDTKARERLSTTIHAVLTSAEMDAIIANATSANVGSFYMYLGESTASYKKGSVYKIGEV